MSALRKGWCPGALRPMQAKDGLLVRLRPSGGILQATTALAVADLAEKYGSGLFDLTARANLQMRGVRETTLPMMQDGLQTLGLLDTDADAESIRNIIASPLAGVHDSIDIRPLVTALERRLFEDKTLHALPGKFGFLIDDGSTPSLADVGADIRFDWDGERFAIGLGGTADEAVQIGSCDKDGLVDEATRIAKEFLSLSVRMGGVRRMRDAIAALREEGVLKTFARAPSPVYGRRWPRREPRSDEGDRAFSAFEANAESPHPTFADAKATFSRKREKESPWHIVGSQTLQSIHCLGIAAPFGRLDAIMLRAAARVAKSTMLGELRLTPWRVMLVPGAAAAALPGYITDPADPRLAVAACVGAAGCARGTTDTQADASALAATLAPNPCMTLHVSGCEKGCAKASPTAVTLVARDGRYDLVRDGRAGDAPIRRGLDIEQARHALAALEPT